MRIHEDFDKNSAGMRRHVLPRVEGVLELAVSWPPFSFTVIITGFLRPALHKWNDHFDKQMLLFVMNFVRLKKI
jgi:hypothetical protein